MRWVLTVPAIWKQPAKQFMREAAYLVSMGRQSRGQSLGRGPGRPPRPSFTHNPEPVIA